VVKSTNNLQFDESTKQALKAVSVAGAFPLAESQLYLPAPGDCVRIEKKSDAKGNGPTVHRAYPQTLNRGEGCDLPRDELRPVSLDFEQAPEGAKPDRVPAWWPVGKLAEWLTTSARSLEASWFESAVFLDHPRKEMSDHVCLDANRGAASEGKIYQTAGLRLAFLPKFRVKEPKDAGSWQSSILSARVEDGQGAFAHLSSLSIWHPLGGERRLVHWQAAGHEQAWKCPEAIVNALKGAKNVRMVLSSPAIFSDGWKPGWLDQASLQGKPPITNAPTLKLVAASLSRWRAVSGWSYEPVDDPDNNGKRKPGPKPIRRMVPAGAVYFFEVVDGDASSLADNGWLRAVSDDPQERLDGFGVATWGTW